MIGLWPGQSAFEAAYYTPAKLAAEVRQGAASWNRFRQKNPNLKIDLRNQVFNKVNLAGANLTDADLRGSIFIHSPLRSARLDRADLRGIDFSNQDFRKTSFRQARMGASDFRYSNFTGADFTKAIMVEVEGTNVIRADLRVCTFYNTNWSSVVFDVAHPVTKKMVTARLSGAKISGAKIPVRLKTYFVKGNSRGAAKWFNEDPN